MPDPTKGKGKSGGARVHYLWVPRAERIYLIFAYGKGDQASLTKEQKRLLKAIVDQIKAEVR